MEINIKDKKIIEIISGNLRYNNPISSIRYSYSQSNLNNDSLIAFYLTYNNTHLISDKIGSIKVNGTQMTPSNIDELLSDLFFFEIEIEDVNGLPEALDSLEESIDAESERAKGEEERIEQKFDDFTQLEDPNGVIDTWKEIENFLEGISDSDRLLTILLDQKQKIRAEFTNMFSYSILAFSNFVTSSYNALLADSNISELDKTNLTSAYTAFKTKSDNLLNAITEATDSGKTTDAQLTSVKEKYNEYASQIALYKSIEETTRQNIVKIKISNIQVGGVNLLTNTRNFFGWEGASSGSALTSEYYKGLRIVKQSVVWQYFRQSYDFEEGVTYTISVYAKAETENTGLYINGGSLTSGYVSDNVSLEWKRYSWTFTAASAATSTIGFLIPGVQTGKVLYLCGYKLTNNKPQNWSPAIADSGLLDAARVLITDTSCTYVANLLTFGTNPRVVLTNGTVKSLTLPNITLPSAGYNDVYIDIENNNVNAVASGIDKTQYLNTNRFLWIGWSFGTTGKYGFPKLIM